MFFDFLKYCLGNKVNISEVIANIDWRELHAFAKKQAIVGFCFEGIARLGNEYPEELRKNPIGQGLLMEWMGRAQMIRRQNMKVNVVAAKLFAQLQRDGMRSCILKGQGNALMYANPYARMPGDIDIWVDADRQQTLEYAKKHFKIEEEMRYHHVGASLDGVPVELHFFPGLMNNPLYNARLQKWFESNVDLQCSNVVSLPDGAGEMAVPTDAFNVVYQLCHMYHHFFDEGIGLRQVIDYYFVVKRLNADGADRGGCGVEYRMRPMVNGIDEKVRIALHRELKHLGLWKFAGALMYVLHEALGLREEEMVVPMDEKRGRLLLGEILAGGNFGQHFSKYGHFTHQGMARKYFLKIWRNMHFVRYYPAEALCEPLFRTWHFCWRLWNRCIGAKRKSNSSE